MALNNASRMGNDLSLSSVMITRYSAMGNVVMTIPVVYSACACYPEVHFVMVTKPSLIGLFVNKPGNLTVVGIDTNGRYHGLSGARLLVKEMRQRYDIDAYVDLQHDSSTMMTGIICQLNGIRVVRFNRAMHNKRQLTRKSGKVMLPLVSSRARYRETFFSLGLTIDERFDTLYGKGHKAPPSSYAAISHEAKPAGQTWIGLAPFAAHPEKEYPVDKMTEVIKMIIARGDARIFVFGGGGREREIATSWAREHPQVISLAGDRYGFEAEFGLLSNLDAIITMDSANMHLASIVGTPTISIWGATHHYCGFKGWRQSEEDMVQAPLSCRPCSIKGDKPCYRHDRLCLTAIRPETIYAKLADKLAQAK